MQYPSAWIKVLPARVLFGPLVAAVFFFLPPAGAQADQAKQATQVTQGVRTGQAAAKPAITLEQAIEIAKTNFPLPAGFTNFASSFNSNDDRQSWSLDWSNPNPPGGSQVVQVDAATGEILNMDCWEPPAPGAPADAGPNSALSRDEALAMATDLLKKLEPDKIKDLHLVQDPGQVIPLTPYGPVNYSFYWQRVVQGIPFPQDGVTINVNAREKRVTGYQFQWTKAEFPAAGKVISPARAVQAFHAAGMLKLQYFMIYPNPGGPLDRPDMPGDKAPRVILVYQLQDPSNGVIDAFTGKPLNLGEGGIWLRPPLNGGGFVGMDAAGGQKAGEVAMSRLSEQELQEVQRNADLITQDEAVAAVKKWVEIPADLTLNIASLMNDWRFPGRRVWYFSWNAADPEKLQSGELRFVSARVDAITGELLGFDLGYEQDAPPGAGTLDRAAAQKLAEDFLQKIQPERFGEVRLAEQPNDPGPKPLKDGQNPPNQSFYYQRLVDGIAFPGNNITVTVDAVTGRITNYNLTWADLKFPPAAQAMPVDKAEDIFLARQPMTLTYVQTYGPGGPGEVHLVYMPLAAGGGPVSKTMDAGTGEALDWQGRPLTSLPRAHQFTDIRGNFAAAEISLLGQAGIFGEYGNTFRPDEKVSAVSLLRAMLMASDGAGAAARLTDTEVMGQARQRGWLAAGEEMQPGDPVSRLTMAKFLVRFLNMDRAARIPGIYRVPFQDAGSVPSNEQGYLALVFGLGILRGDGHNFRPMEPATRAQAAMALVRAINARQ